jgi:uncharacterized protein YcbX
MRPVTLGTVLALARYPVKSLQGEALAEAEVDGDGVVGDRRWCVRTEQGFVGSGKNTRRFRRVDGLLDLAARTVDGAAPEVTFPDGAAHAVGTAEADAALATHTGRALNFAQGDGPYHDDGPVHLLTTASLRRLGDVLGEDVDQRRFRANIVLDTPDLEGLPEVGWAGRWLAVGEQVVLGVVCPMPRCVMVSMAAAELPADSRVLKAVYAAGDGDLGVLARVVSGGTVRLGDAVRWA